MAVDLGFIDIPSHPWILHPCFFPSKVGGKPAWLNPEKLPTEESVQCSNCKTPMVFLLQVYAPNDDVANSFHRTIFVFCCKNTACYQETSSCPIKVLRCCLPRSNSYYDSEPPDYDSPNALRNCKYASKLCGVCGCLGKKVCSRCKTANYCGKEHQVMDWKTHKLSCCNEKQHESGSNVSNSFLFPEYELVIEHDNELSKNPSDNDNISNTTSYVHSSNNFSDEELVKHKNIVQEDKAFVKFKDKISSEPEQIVRYKKSGVPLWCSEQNQPMNDDIPPCQCGSTRTFEFQIMPHLLSHLDVDTAVEGPTIDWGTIAIYTCLADCTPADTAYHNEFAWKQIYSE